MRRPLLLSCALAALVVGAIDESASAAEDVRGLWIIQRDGTGLTLLTAEPLPGLTNCGTPEWSPDGARIVCDAAPGRQWGKSHIVVLHVAGPNAGKVEDLGLGVQPTWSPDGQEIAFYTNPNTIPGEPGGMWVMQADGGNRTFLGQHVLPRFTPSGAWIISTESFGKSRQLRRVDPALGVVVETIAIADVEFVSKPSFVDERSMVASLNVDGKPVLGIVDLRKAPAVKRIVYDGRPECKLVRASPTGTEGVCILSLPELGNQLHLISLTEKDAQPVRIEPEAGPVWVKDPAWSPDGQQIVFSCTEREGEFAPSIGIR